MSFIPSAIDHAVIDELMTQLGDDNGDLLDDLIGSYLDDSTPQVVLLVGAAAVLDARTVLTIAHTLRSTSALLGATHLALLLSQAEAAARSDLPGLAAAAQAVEDEYGRVSQHLLDIRAHGQKQRPDLPPIVSAAQWQQARDELLAAEKLATRAQDALAAQRRRLPMVRMGDGYTFSTPSGPRTLIDLFEGRPQLVVYQFMDVGPDHYCPGCTWFTDNVPTSALALLADRGVSWATVSAMPLEQIEAYATRKGWTLPFVSSHGTSFAEDCGAGGGFLLSTFLREGEDVYRTYSTSARGVDRLVFANNILDLTAYGRQEDWEDSPAGWPQHPTYG